ncbi:MAG: putative peptidoglycan glycosyltransferase FtsW [Dongiaceae bacterium]
MMAVARTDRSIMGRWWWTVDRWTLLAIAVLIAFGALMALAASPAVASRIRLDSFSLFRQHFALLPVVGLTLVGVSLLDVRGVRRLAVFGMLGGLVLLTATLVIGTEIKGATRWISLGGFSLQPSEFMKPCFAVVSAWMFSLQHGAQRLPGNVISIALYGLVMGLILLQPDLGMAVVVTATWFAQFFLAGLSIVWVGALVIVGIAGLVGAYFAFEHVRDRIDSFLDPAAGDRYQIDRSLEAFANGGWFGRGPGEGTVKLVLPDAHSDFVFSVLGEEFGTITALLIVVIFGFVILRGMARLLNEQNLFVLLAAAGLLVSFGLQAAINMASALSMIPTKGMTLPFISYGGSSLIALSLAMGMLLALTRRRPGMGEYA